MPRAERVLIEGGLYHVYNRLGRGERVFDDDVDAAEFVRLLREVVDRDGLTVFAWCLMPNHYHLAVRMGGVSLDRPIRSLQYRVTRSVNLRRRVFGPLWQGRYKAKLIGDQRYLDQLLSYIHLNPVSAGLVKDPADHRWSGHRELLGAVRKPIVDTDMVLRVFAKTRRAARAAYVRTIKGLVEEEWIGEDPGRLPWWRLGRPPKGEHEDPEESIRERRRREELGPEWRPVVEAGDFVARCAREVGVDVNSIRSRNQAQDLVRAREVVMVLGVERYGLRVKDLARAMKKSPDGMSKSLARAVQRRTEDEEFRGWLDRMDQAIAAGDGD